MSGSGLFSKAKAVNESLVAPGKAGVAGEVGDLRRDVLDTLAPLAAFTVEEFTNALAAATNNLMAATASVATARTLSPAATPATGVLTQATLDNLAAAPRQIQFTTAGSTPAHQPATATIIGKDERGKPQTEVVALPQTAATFLSAFFYSDITRIELAAGDGTGATLALGLGSKIGLSQKLRKRAGLAAVLMEIYDGAKVTNGTFATADEGTTASVVGTGDLTGVGVPASLNGLTLIASIDGAAPVTVTYATPADAAAVVAQTVAGLGASKAVLDSAKYLKLTSLLAGIGSSVKITGGTGLAILGLTAAETKGVGNGQFGSYTPNTAPNGTHDYAVFYEYTAQ